MLKELTMERKLETMFDTVPVLTDAVLLDSTEVDKLMKEQRNITMGRISTWLRNNARIFELEWDTAVARELKNLADDLDHLATIDAS